MSLVSNCWCSFIQRLKITLLLYAWKRKSARLGYYLIFVFAWFSTCGWNPTYLFLHFSKFGFIFGSEMLFKDGVCYACIHALVPSQLNICMFRYYHTNFTLKWVSPKLKFDVMPWEMMRSILNGTDHPYVDPTAEFHKFGIWFACTKRDRGFGLLF